MDDDRQCNVAAPEVLQFELAAPNTEERLRELRDAAIDLMIGLYEELAARQKDDWNSAFTANDMDEVLSHRLLLIASDCCHLLHALLVRKE